MKKGFCVPILCFIFSAFVSELKASEKTCLDVIRTFGSLERSTLQDAWKQSSFTNPFDHKPENFQYLIHSIAYQNISGQKNSPQKILNFFKNP